MSISHDKIVLSGITALEQDRLYQRIMAKWLKGYSISDIGHSEGNLTQEQVMRGITVKRQELALAQKADIDHIVAERIAGLKLIKREAFEYMELMPEKAPQLLTVALRAEETQAKLQGVLSEKVMHLGRIEHTVKMYDFEDKTPGAIVIDAVGTVVSDITFQEEVLPKIEEHFPVDEEKMLDVNGGKEEEIEVVMVVKKAIHTPNPVIVNAITILRPGDEMDALFDDE